MFYKDLANAIFGFIKLKDSHVSYDHFYASYKARGHVIDDAMCAHVKFLNLEPNDLG